MYGFSYRRAATVSEAVAALRASVDGKFLAGGMSLIPVLKQRLAMPTDLIDLTGIPDLASIRREGNVIAVGALATYDAVAGHPAVRGSIPGLADLAAEIGDPQVRNRGTIGGSVALNDPSADYPAAIVALNATIHTDRRAIAADAMFTGMFETALEADELITRISIPIPEASGYAKFTQSSSHYPVAGVMVAKTAGGVRVAVTGAGPRVFRVPEMEAALAADFSAAALEGIEVPAEGLNADMHASAPYRAHLITVMARRAVTTATRTPGGLGAGHHGIGRPALGGQHREGAIALTGIAPANEIGVRESLPGDISSIETLYLDAFPDENLLPLVRDLLSQEAIVLSLIGLADEALVGHVVFTSCGIAGRTDKVALLGPLAVAPNWRRQGIGGSLVGEGFRRLKSEGVAQVYVLGDPAYYGRLGFKSDHSVSPPYPLPEEWLGAWQSISLRGARPPLSGKLSLPRPWLNPALWAP